MQVLGSNDASLCLQPSLLPNRCIPRGQLQGTPQVLVLHSRELKLGECRTGLEGEGSIMLPEAWRGMGRSWAQNPQKPEVKINTKSKYIVSLWSVN